MYGYDLIISISIFGHVGWDEQPQEPVKLLAMNLPDGARHVDFLRSIIFGKVIFDKSPSDPLFTISASRYPRFACPWTRISVTYACEGTG